MKGPLVCAVLVAVVYYTKLIVMNTMSLYVFLGITGITCYMLTYIPFIYRLSCALRRTALWYVSLLYLSTCTSVRGLV